VKLKLGLPQLAPQWINREAGVEKVVETIELAAKVKWGYASVNWILPSFAANDKTLTHLVTTPGPM
jgi:hypothetical protein